MTKFLKILLTTITITSTITACSGGGSSSTSPSSQEKQTQNINKDTTNGTEITSIDSKNTNNSNALLPTTSIEPTADDQENKNTEATLEKENTEITKENTEITKEKEAITTYSFSGEQITNSVANSNSSTSGDILTLKSAQSIKQNEDAHNISHNYNLTQVDELRKKSAQELENTTILIEDNNLILHLYTGKINDKEAIASYISTTKAFDESVILTEEDRLNGNTPPLVNEYYQGGNNALKVDNDKVVLNANYSGVFFYVDNESNLSKQKHLKLFLQDKKITGKVTESYSAQDALFTVEGDTNALNFKPTELVDVKNVGVSEPKFYNSSNQEQDVKYVSGTIKADDWQGVYNTEKQ